MSPMGTTTRTITLMLPPKDRGWFLNLFTQHLLAKLLAVLLASFLVFLIDQELSTEIFSGEVLVTNEPLPQEASLLLLVPPD